MRRRSPFFFFFFLLTVAAPDSARNLINYIRGGMGLLVLIVAGVIWIAVTMSLELSEELGLSTGVYAVVRRSIFPRLLVAAHCVARQAITFVGFGYLAEYAAYMATLIIYFIIIRLQVRYAFMCVRCRVLRQRVRAASLTTCVIG